MLNFSPFVPLRLLHCLLLPSFIFILYFFVSFIFSYFINFLESLFSFFLHSSFVTLVLLPSLLFPLYFPPLVHSFRPSAVNPSFLHSLICYFSLPSFFYFSFLTPSIFLFLSSFFPLPFSRSSHLSCLPFFPSVADKTVRFISSFFLSFFVLTFHFFFLSSFLNLFLTILLRTISFFYLMSKMMSIFRILSEFCRNSMRILRVD